MGKVYHLNDLEEFFGADDWKLTINLSDLWKKYSNNEITLQDFNNKYYDRIVEYKNDITNLGNDVWLSFEEILPKLKENIIEQEQLISLYDNLYDLADKNDIQIKTK